MAAVQASNLGLRFLLELCALGALGFWGYHAGNGTLMRLLLGLGAPLAAAVIWATFGSPKASTPLHGAGRLLLEAAVFGAAVLALYSAGRASLATTFGLVLLGNRLLMLVWKQ